MINELRSLEGSKEVRRTGTEVEVVFEQKLPEETIACVFTIARENDYTITQYFRHEDNLRVEMQLDPQEKLKDWRHRID